MPMSCNQGMEEKKKMKKKRGKKKDFASILFDAGTQLIHISIIPRCTSAVGSPVSLHIQNNRGRVPGC